MGKFKLYNVDLKNLTPGIHEFEYLLENKFFVDIDGDQVQKGKVKVNLTVKRSSMMFEMNFQIEGVVMVPCDRCLDDMEIPIDTHNRLVVKFGKEYAEESDDIALLHFPGACTCFIGIANAINSYRNHARLIAPSSSGITTTSSLSSAYSLPNFTTRRLMTTYLWQQIRDGMV